MYGPGWITTGLLLVLVAPDTATTQRTPPVQTKPAATESHLLFFERVVLADAPEGFGPTSFTISAEKWQRRGKNKGLMAFVTIKLMGSKSAPAITLPHLESIVRNVETTGDSTWLLSELSFRPNPKDADTRVVRSLVFAREQGGPDPDLEIVPRGHEILAAWTKALDSVADKDLLYRVTGFDLSYKSREPLLSFDVDVLGQRFRSGFVQLENAFVDAIEAGGAFVGFDEARDEKLLADHDVMGASYQLRLRLRERHSVERDARPKRKRQTDKDN